MEPWLPNALHNADCALLVVDLSDPECVDHVPAILQRLRERKVELVEHWPRPIGGAVAPPSPTNDEDALADPFILPLPTLLVANKSDLDPDPDEVRVLEELIGVRFPALAVSARTGANCERLAPLLFEGLAVVRVYTKAPGREADRERPFTVRIGDSVRDVARLVHKDIAAGLRHARLWGSSGQFDGQQVGPDHLVADGDVIELHAR
jgi:ribosome-interacting GTPase 1